MAPDLAASFAYDWQDDGFVGPPAPRPAQDAVFDVAAADQAVAGPPLPDHWGQSDTPAPAIVTLAEARASIREELDQHHGLPFDPLAAALREDAKPKAKAAAKKASPFEEFLAEEHEYDTVTYTRKLTHELAYGETMSEVLGAAGVSQGEVEEWVRAAGRAYNLNHVYAGQELSLLMQMPETELRRLSLEIDHTTRLVAERDAGEVVARREEIPYERRLRVAGGTIERSLYVSAMKQGVPDKIISEVAEILGWEVNFGALYPGASFRVVYEELARTDTPESIPGRVLAVEVENRQRRYEGFYFRMPDGSHAGYYNRQGEALGRSFLRYPVAYSRISSQFSKARFHPVLKRRVPHYGVDFAAPPGTPVKAVADGKVEKAGWYGGNGRFVKIRHDRVYETGYAHLSRIARGLRAGANVKKGQIIGYVGSSGLATGPHLHFAMYRGGKYVDPLKANLPRPQPLAGNARAGFRMTADMMERTYARAGFGHEEETTRVATAIAEEESAR